MTIQEDCVVSIHYTLKDKAGKVLDTSDGQEPLFYLHGKKNIIPGLEKELNGKAEKDVFETVIAPEDGYGEHQEALITEVSKEELQQVDELEVGVQLQAQTEQGVQIFTITEVKDDTVILDGNHPLAGMELHFSGTVETVREATAEELAHGHVHGTGGVQH